METFLGLGLIGCVLFALRYAWPAARPVAAVEAPVEFRPTAVSKPSAKPRVVTIGEQIAGINAEFEAACEAVGEMSCSAEEKEAHRFQLMIQRDRRLAKITR